jgi:hypothetical protein
MKIELSDKSKEVICVALIDKIETINEKDPEDEAALETEYLQALHEVCGEVGASPAETFEIVKESLEK